MNFFRAILFLSISSALAVEQEAHYVDLNFDGHLDKMVFASKGGGRNARNVLYDVWLFDPVSNSYVYNESLSEIGEPTPDPKTKTIETFWRSTPVDTISTYRWVDSNLTLIKETTIHFLNGGTQTTVKELRNGSMVTTSNTFEKTK